MLKKYAWIFIAVFLLLALLSGYKMFVYFQRDPFYRNGSEWDHLRFPLIKPYYAIKVGEKIDWQIPLDLEGDPSQVNLYHFLHIPNVQKVAVNNGVIMVYATHKPLADESAKYANPRWYALVVDEKIEMGFETEAEFLAYVQQFGIDRPVWREPDDISIEYDRTRCLDWIPDCK
jgi:hypothetical protein